MKTASWLAVALSLLALPAAAEPLTPPASGKIPVAFLISDGAVVIDFTGPWSVFETVRGDRFQLYTVAESKKPVHASSGLTIVPDYTLATAPRPKIIVIPAQGNDSAAVLEWLRKTAPATDVTMSVCNGAFILAESGLLDGKSATAYHDSFKQFEQKFPRVRLERGARFVESGKLATAGGLSSGIDLALRVVERYWGREVAESTAFDLEYQGRGWTDPKSNSVYAKAQSGGVEDPVCGMRVDPKMSSVSTYRGQRYYFCSPDEKASFDAHPELYVKAK